MFKYAIDMNEHEIIRFLITNSFDTSDITLKEKEVF